MTKSLAMCLFLLQQPLSRSRLGISVAMWKIAAETQRVSISTVLFRHARTRTHTHARTLHDVIVPTVGELPVVPVLIQTPQEDLVRIAVLQVDESAQARQEAGVAVGTVLVGQDGRLVAHLQRQGEHTEEGWS